MKYLSMEEYFNTFFGKKISFGMVIALIMYNYKMRRF